MADDDAVATEPTARRVDDVATTEVGERPAPSSSQPDPIGKLLRGTYRLERFIGEGGMGRVYEASHERLSRRFAVKLLGGEHSRNDKTVSRMEREADITSRLDHAHIVDVIDFDYADDGRPFIVMELLKGETLARRLQRERVISDLDHVEAIVEQVTSALAAAHGAGIVHRDLKPANIFLCRRASGEKLPFVKVMDFGISKDMHAAGHELTAAIAVLGTPPYMSPEQIQGRTAHADARADVFALGAVIFRMLGGAPPFRSDSKAESMFRQATSGKPIETPAWTRVAEPIRRVVLRALSAKPDARQVDAAELGRQMKAAIGEARAGGAARAHGETQGDEAGDTLDVPPRTRRGARGPSQRVTR
ncbi:MAG: serine/threonine protein kinase, partial [Myxococcales bacterium]|nr:serine/threonine protein kinase [Myxococcales bacterium]